jgi:hypothetical protein
VQPLDSGRSSRRVRGDVEDGTNDSFFGHKGIRSRRRLAAAEDERLDVAARSSFSRLWSFDLNEPAMTAP